MSQDNLIQLKSKEDPTTVYWVHKNKKKLAEHKIQRKKYSKKLRKHVVFKEAKK